MFQFLRKSKPIEAKAATLADPDPELIEILTGADPEMISVAGSAALHTPAVAAAVRVIAEACATLPIYVERQEGKDWTDDPEQPAAKLLHGDVNDWTSGFEFVRDLVAQALTSDAGGMAWVGRAEGRAVELIQYRSGMLGVDYADTGEPTYRLNSRVLAGRDVIHLRGPFNKCPATLAREAIATARQMERHAHNLFKRGARPGGVIQFPAGANVSPTVVSRIKAAWRATYEGSANSGGTAVLYAGGTFNPLTFSSVDAQFLELRKFQILEVARAFRVPPQMLYELDRATWSNGEQMGKEFLTYSLEPWLRGLEACLTKALIAVEDRGTVRIRFDRDDLTRASLTERATAINSLRASEVLSADEGRDWLDLPPRADGKGGDYSNPNINQRPGGQA